jgi:hypothetical protein
MGTIDASHFEGTNARLQGKLNLSIAALGQEAHEHGILGRVVVVVRRFIVENDMGGSQ